MLWLRGFGRTPGGSDSGVSTGGATGGNYQSADLQPETSEIPIHHLAAALGATKSTTNLSL